MVGATNDMRDNLLRQQLEEVIDDELQKLEFASLCKKIALKVVERVQKIDNEHNEIKSLYGELGAQVASFLAESDGPRHGTQRIYAQNNEMRRDNNDTTVSHVIVIDDDEDANNTEGLDSHAVDSSGLCSTASPSLNITDCDEEVVNNSVNNNASTEQQVVDLNEKSNNTTTPEKEGSTDIVNSNGVDKICAPLTPPLSEPIISPHEESVMDTTSEYNIDISHSGVEDNNVEDEEGDEPSSDLNDEGTHNDSDLNNEGTLNDDPILNNVDANIENALPSNTPINNAVSHLDITETDSQSSSIIESDSQSSSIIPPDDATVQSRSPLILKITAAKESLKTAETNKYSSTMVSPVVENKDIESSNHTEVSSGSTTTGKPKRKPFKFKAGTIVYAKPCGSDIWYEAELLKEVASGGKKQPKYQVRFMGGQRLRQKILLKSIATKDAADIEQFELGTRVVAGRPSDTVNTTISKKYKDISSGNNINVMFAGVVAEVACEVNRSRYLVFFDDGYAQYFNITSLFLVIKPSRDVWNDVAVDCQEFIKEYLQEYPYRPLVCTTINSTMQTEWNGEWWKSKVVSIDASLIKMLFDVDKRSEWIYRGTTRLEPLYNHFNPPNLAKKKKKDSKAVSDGSYVDEKITHPQFGVSKYSIEDPYGKQQRDEWNLPPGTLKRMPSEGSVTVSDINQSPDDNEKDKIMPKKLRVQSGIEGSRVGKEIEKSSTISSQEAFGVLGALQMSPTNGVALPTSQQTSVPTTTSPIHAGDEISEKSTSTIVQSPKLIPDPPTPPVISLSSEKRGPHPCDVSCIKEHRKIINEHNIGIFNYLSIPFKLGWKRESSKKKTGWHRDIYYRTPCNRRLRNLAEVTTYISMTKCSNVAIDMFCFHPSISCRNQPLRPKPTLAKIDDLSGGKETCPIVCVNEINEELPNPIVYISNRLPAEDVSINTDPGFLVCCDCVDNCQDKSKCGCAQLTTETSKAIDDVINKNAGYQYRRLKETITTGIYECNQNCSCSRETCYNRVVQNGIQLRLQVFMTESCGWGLRCINDIPKGTFICTYTGQVLNEQTANREGMDFGDEYLAELDHIEVVEKAKDDYEEDVPELRDNITISSDDDSDSDSSSSVLSISSDSSDIEEGNTTKKRGIDDKLHEMEKPLGQTLDTEISSEPTDSLPPETGNLNELQKLPSSTTDNVSGKTSPVSSKIDSLCSSLQGVANNKEIKPMSNDISDKKLLDIPNQDNIHSDITVHSLAVDPTISGKALARKSTSNKAYAHKSSGGKVSEKTAANVSTKKESYNLSTRSLYDGDKQMYVIDAKCFGNVGRFMNHSCSPNLFVQNVMVDTHDLRFPWVAFFAQQNIPSYTELTWDYNYEIGSVADKTLTCKCGSKNCKGRLL